MSDAWSTLREQIEYFSQPFPEAAIAFRRCASRGSDIPIWWSRSPGWRIIRKRAPIPITCCISTPCTCSPPGARRRRMRRWSGSGHHSEEVVDQLLGDTVTESYGRCLASVCNGDLAPLKDWSRTGRRALGAARGARCDHGAGVRGRRIARGVDRLSDATGRSRSDELRQPGRTFKRSNCSTRWFRLPQTLARWRCWNAFVAGSRTSCLIRRLPICPGSRHIFPGPSRPAATKHLGRGKGYVRSVKTEIGWWAGFNDKPARANRPADARVPVRQGPKVGRNDPCPCGSGKKYKKCHGA
jgi:hypothetical protein